MKAAIVQGKNDMVVKDVPTPGVVPDSFLLKVHACTVCGSDLRILESGNDRVKVPAIIGHEISGEIVEAGPGLSGFRVGERIAVGADVPCGRCDWCLNGMGNCCDTNLAMGYQFAGGYAEYCLIEPTVVRFGPVARIPDGVDMEHAALAEPLACCINGLERVGLGPGQTAAILGAGPIGIMLVKLAKAFGSEWTLLADIDPGRLQQARLAGADSYLPCGDAEAFVSGTLEATRGRGVDVILTACPAVEAQELALRIVAKRGRVNLFGGLPATARDIRFSSNLLHYREASVTGSHGSTPVQHARALELIASRRVDLSGMVTHRFPLDRIHDAFAAAKARLGLKAVVRP
ncbi:MAG: alcohol dehydrogenase catalytic domain-containing protein [Elusimicrobiota bacterium]